mgnify:CR=1 FL=1
MAFFDRFFAHVRAFLGEPAVDGSLSPDDSPSALAVLTSRLDFGVGVLMSTAWAHAEAAQTTDLPLAVSVLALAMDTVVYAPAGTPREIVNKLNSEINKLMSAPDTRKALYDAGVEVSPSTPEAMTEYMAQEMVRWGKVVKETGIKLE